MTEYREGFENQAGEHNTWKVFPTSGGVHLPAEMRQINNCYVPAGWTGWFEHAPGEADELKQLHQPETHFTAEALRVRSGLKAWQCFWFGRCGRGGLFTSVPTKPGDIVRVEAYAQAWSNHKDGPHPHDGKWSEWAGYDVKRITYAEAVKLTGDSQLDAARNIRFRVLLDPAGTEDIWAPTMVMDADQGQCIYNGYMDPAITNECVATGEKVTVWLLARAVWPFTHNDTFWDDVTITVESGEPEPPPPDPCEGKARIPFDGFAVLLPQDATEAEFVTAFRAYEQRKTTFTISADDAFIYAGKASQTVAVLSAHRWAPDGKAAFTIFRDEHYPNAVIVWDDVTLGALSPIPEPPAGLNAYQRAGWMLAQKLLLWHGLKLAQPNTYKEYHITEGGEFGNNRGSYYHNGLDLRASWAAYGTEITCALAGTVEVASDVGQGFGVQVRTRSVVDGQTVYVRYAHLVSPPYVKVGDLLSPGALIGKADSGGVSTGDHQHLDVWWSDESGYSDPTVLLTPWKDDEPEPEPPAQFNPRVMTLHLQANVEASQRYVTTCKPAGFKIVQNAQDLPTYAVLNPGMRCVYRSMSEHDDPVTFVNANLDTLHQVADMFAARGLPLIDGHYFWWGLWNEKWGYDRADNIVWRDREIAAIEYLAQKEPRVGAVAFEGGVGNIQVANFDLLVSLMQKVRDYNGMAGLHSYFGAIPTRCSLDHYEDEGKWLQYRFEMTDDYLVQHGIRINWFLSEGGAIYYEPPRNMPSCDPGWRYKDTLNGDWAQYLVRLEQLAQHLYEWNVAHGGRLKGYAIFTQGGGDKWKWFELGSAEIDALAAMQIRNWPL